MSVKLSATAFFLPTFNRVFYDLGPLVKGVRQADIIVYYSYFEILILSRLLLPCVWHCSIPKKKKVKFSKKKKKAVKCPVEILTFIVVSHPEDQSLLHSEMFKGLANGSTALGRTLGSNFHVSFWSKNVLLHRCAFSTSAFRFSGQIAAGESIGITLT